MKTFSDYLFQLEEDLCEISEKIKTIEWLSTSIYKNHVFRVIPEISPINEKANVNATIYVGSYESNRIPATLLLDMATDVGIQIKKVNDKYYSFCDFLKE